MRRTKQIPEVNAGSMADIAFLLLIFFLVTAVIPKDHGLNRKLPKECEGCEITLQKRNNLSIAINKNNEIMIDDKIVAISEIRNLTKSFIDNNGDGSCNYCSGANLETSSDNPTKAVVSLQADRNSSYNTFIEVQDELTKAYFELRKNYANKVLQKTIDNLTKVELQQVKNAYPFILSEAETRN